MSGPGPHPAPGGGVAPAMGPGTRLLALLGDPVAHSGSPAMHNAAFAAAGVDAVYLAFCVRAADLPAAVAGLRALGAVGANVTVPHKEAALALADRAEPTARRAGAANVLAFTPEGIVAANTDVPGFLAALEEAGETLRGRRVAVVGAGGAARAVALAALEAGARQVAVLARRPEQALALCRALADPRLVPHPWGAGPGAALPPGVEVVVHCTPLGLRPGDPLPVAGLEPVAAGGVVVDLIYNPPDTPLLAAARAAGLRAVGGAGMLVWQAALSWEHWFGRRGPVEVMREALARWLAARG